MDGWYLIHVLVVAESARARGALRKTVWPEHDITVAGEAAAPDEALEQARVHRFDVVVVDLSLPGGQAIELVRRLERGFPELPVVAFTDAEDDSGAAARSCGAVACVAKSHAAERLARAIRAAAVRRWDREVSCDRDETMQEPPMPGPVKPEGARRVCRGPGDSVLMTRLD